MSDADNPGAGPAEASGAGNGELRGHGLLAKLGWAMHSDPGEVRPHNEDFAGVYAPTIPDDAWDRGPLFVVCDGLGGHAAGEVASRLAVETALDAWCRPDPEPPQQAVRTVARAANLAVFDAAIERRKQGMGTTFTALTLAGREAIIGHVGDSRCYQIRAGHCSQLTADHSRVGEMLRMGMLTPEQAARHPGRSQLTRAVGTEHSVQVDVVRTGTEAGDVFVLCSDGVWDVVSQPSIAAIAGAVGTPEVPTVADAANQLIEAAIKAETADNVTALVVKVTTGRPIPSVTGRRSLFRRSAR